MAGLSGIDTGAGGDGIAAGLGHDPKLASTSVDLRMINPSPAAYGCGGA